MAKAVKKLSICNDSDTSKQKKVFHVFLPNRIIKSFWWLITATLAVQKQPICSKPLDFIPETQVIIFLRQINCGYKYYLH